MTRDGVIAQMRRALEVIQLVVMDGTGAGSGMASGSDNQGQTSSARDISPLSVNAVDYGISLPPHRTVAFKAIKDFEVFNYC